MSYCAYLRKSRKDIEAEEHGEMDTLLRHENILKDLAKKMNVVISKFYKEVVSGDSIESRPVVQEALRDIESGMWKGVFVVEVERLARGDTSDQGLVARTFKYSSTLIITPMKTYDPNNEFDEEFFEFGLFMSRREYKTIKRRLQAGRKQSVTEGKYVGSVAPYGYEKYKLKGEKGHSLKIIPEQAEIVKLIYKLYTYGEEQPDGSLKRLGTTLLSEKLNNMDISKSRKWAEPGLLYILKNPVYIAKLWWNHRPEEVAMENGKIIKSRPVNNDYEVYDAIHEPIIDEKTWNETQYALNNTQVVKVPNAFVITNNPLAGLVYCKLCGRSMVRRPYSSGGDDTLLCPTKGCSNISSKLIDVETEVLNSLKNWLENYKINYEYEFKGIDIEEQIKSKNNQILALIEEEKKTSLQLNNLHDLLEQGVYDIGMFKQRNDILNNKMTELQQSLITMNEDIKLLKSSKKNFVEFIPRVEEVVKTYETIDEPIKKNEMLKRIIIKIEYFKDEKGTKSYKAPFTLNLFPRLPS